MLKKNTALFQKRRKVSRKNMNKLKKLTMLLLMFCFTLSLGSIKAYAANGVIFFTDLETAVGETVTITGSVVSRGDNLEDIELRMSYDPTYVRFVSGEGVSEESEGKLVYKGTGTSVRLDFKMEFQAIEQGSTRINLDQATVYTNKDALLDCDLGYSDLSIAAGDPSKITPPVQPGLPVNVGGANYELVESFTDGELPKGFIRGTINFQGQSFQGAVQESGEMKLGYLIGADQKGTFFIYDEGKSEFSPFEQVIVSETSSIVLLPDDGTVKLPSEYDKVNLKMNGHDFPAWQNPSNADYYLMYAVNSSGEKGMYRYDSIEDTYQRFDVPAAKDKKETKAPSGFWGKMIGFMRNNVEQFILGAVLLVLLLIVLIIIICVKLRHRNLELDELYDEYDIDQEEPPVQKPALKAAERKIFAGRSNKDEYEEEVVDLDDDDDFEAFDDDDFIIYEDEDMDEPIEQVSKQLQSNEKPSKKRKGRQTEQFDIEFIELD